VFIGLDARLSASTSLTDKRVRHSTDPWRIHATRNERNDCHVIWCYYETEPFDKTGKFSTNCIVVYLGI
jgi:hypothetical protein